MNNNVMKFRHELKYICSSTDLQMIDYRLRNIMTLDAHADNNGMYVIRSVYFDDYSRSCYYANENGTDPRYKFRIRAYDYSDEIIFLEKKMKVQGMTGKKKCRLDKTTCMKMLSGEDIVDHYGQDPLLDEWIVKKKSKLLRPVMLGEYVRVPYIYQSGNVRITFDKNICTSYQIKDIFNKDISRIAVLPAGYHVLEVKYDDFFPDTIYSLINNGHLIQTTFSKFYLGCNALGGNVYEF